MAVPILKQGDTLIASLQAEPTDEELLGLRRDLADLAGRHRSRKVVLDVTLLDVIDSFAARMLSALAETLRLRGADTVLVGIQPDVAMSMVQLGLSFDNVETALDLDDGLAVLGYKQAQDAGRRRGR